VTRGEGVDFCPKKCDVIYGRPLNVNRIRSKNFQKNVSEQQLACRCTCSMNLKLGSIEASLASCDKVIATWLRYGNKFLVHNIHKVAIAFLLVVANCPNATTVNSHSFKII